MIIFIAIMIKCLSNIFHVNDIPWCQVRLFMIKISNEKISVELTKLSHPKIIVLLQNKEPHNNFQLQLHWESYCAKKWELLKASPTINNPKRSINNSCCFTMFILEQFMLLLKSCLNRVMFAHLLTNCIENDTRMKKVQNKDGNFEKIYSKLWKILFYQLNRKLIF